MKINNINSKINISKKQPKQKEKQNIGNISNAKKEYNVSFFGYIPKMGNTYKGQIIPNDIQMQPMQEYRINEDSVFKCSNFYINLNSDELKHKVKSLRNGENFVIGRDATKLENMPETMSRKHLRISKNRYGQLTACDLNSMNGTILKSNVETIPLNEGKKALQAGKYYLLPFNAVISADKEKIHLNEYKNIINTLENGTALLVGRGESSDIRIDNKFVSYYHMSLEPYNGQVLVRDLYSTNGSNFEYCEQHSSLRPPSPNELLPPPKHYQNDYSYIIDTSELKKGIPTRIPNDCQIYLGNHFSLDMRNPNILNLLEKKGKVTIGRGSSCDLTVSDFYSHVSREHLQLEKIGNDIIATDLNAMNASKIIPKNKIKAFNGGVADIKLSQHNIGDCYLLANLYALSRTTKGQQLIENMVNVDGNGNYVVNLYANRGPIVVRPDQLDGQSLNGTNKICVSGDLGIRAIERAYGRMVNNFEPGECTLHMVLDDGGYPDVALKNLTGLDSKSYKIKNINIHKKLSEISQKGLDNYVLTCTTSNGKYNGYVDYQRRFNERHAYGIKNIDQYSQTIEIVNPHNTMFSKTISWNEFAEHFNYLYVGNLQNIYNF
ncbi:FHA domain-containing protein [bacterium]|nr:FHA domain-containing protein [bacterium]